MKKTKLLLSAVTLGLVFTGCGVTQPNVDTRNVIEKKQTVGAIQQGIYQGMYSADVIKTIGSPNIITRNKSGETTWVYDKVSTYTKKEYDGLSFVNMNNNDFVMAGGLALAGYGLSRERELTYAASHWLLPVALVTLGTLFNSNRGYETVTEQRTLTLVLDFNTNEELKSFSYNYSTF